MPSNFGGEGRGQAPSYSPNSVSLKLASAPPRPARLVFLLQDLTFGGTQRQTLELARRLNPARFQVEIWVLAAGEHLTPLAGRVGIPVIRLGRHQQVGPAALARLGRRLINQKLDVLMPLTVVPNIWGRMLGRLARVPLIIGNCRGGGAPRQQFERRLWPLAHHILCNSQAIQRVLTDSCGVPSARLTTILNGVDTDYFQPPAAPSAGPSRVLCVARLVPEKDHDTLLAAFHLTAQEHPEAELWLVGDGPRLPALRELAQRLSISDRVKFIPPREDLRLLLHQASLLVLSSQTEALPNVVLEAMAAGLPVVATRVGGVPELVELNRTGWLVNPGDAPALAAALSQALADPDARQAMGRAGRERAVKHFSLETMARKYESLLDRLLHETRCRRAGKRSASRL
jgi:glycosyltransferase involved in cell wall biosynthesis